MESFTLTLFVLGLLIAALLVTQTIRRELKMREQMKGDLRRASMHMRRAAPARVPHATHAPGMQQHTHNSPPNSV
jgi:hypothetical protein